MIDLIKELLAERMRFLLTVIAIIWGTVSIGSMLAIGEGLRQNFAHTLAASGKNVIVLQGGQITKSSHGVGVNQAVNLTEHDYLSIKQNFPSMHVTAEYTFGGAFVTANKHTSISVSAVTANYAEMRNISLQHGGRFINNLDIQQTRPVIVLGNQIAKDLFGAAKPVGKKMLINNVEFLVVGVANSKMQVWAYQDMDDNLAWIPQSTYHALTPEVTIKSILFVLDDIKMNATVKQQIINIIAVNHGITGDLTGVVEWRDSQQLQEMTAKFFMGMQIFLGIIGGLTLIVAGVGIGNVMLVSVKRRTREIGIRMALGARAYQVLWHYIAGALLATGIGGFIGLLMTMAIVAGLNRLRLPADYEQFLGQMHPQLSFTVVILVISILGIIGFLAGFFPARFAAKINPAEALRHE